MAKLKVTHRVDSHRVNPRYKCLVINLLGDPTFHYKVVKGRLVKADWMPRDDDLLEVIRRLAQLSPTFRKKLWNEVMWW